MSEFDLVIKNGIIVNEEKLSKADVLIKDGKIVDIGLHIKETKAKQIIDAEGLYLFPGIIDSHVHFNEPGRSEWEGLETGSKSLAAGGATLFFDMPLNSHPPTTSEQAFHLKNGLAKEKSVIDYRLWGGVVPGNLDELEKLLQCGVIGFKAFMSNSGIDDFQSADDRTLLQAMKKIAELHSILAVHAESDTITEFLGKEINWESDHIALAFSNARPIFSEIEAVQRIIAYAEATKCRLHIVHISSADVLEPILAAKRRGLDISVETCPHYLSLTMDDLEKLRAVAKCAPPLRSKQEVDNLWEAIRKGEIDVIGSDHSPSLPSMKMGNLLEAWGGISGCQTTLSVLLEEGYWQRGIPLEMISKITSTNPARRFGLYPNKGSILKGYDADIAIVDVNEKFILKKEDLYYKNKISPYIGKTYRGRVKATISRGELVYSRFSDSNKMTT
ncbi:MULTISPECIES: allantoinase [Bacillaceae]|uniref:allantoinase n=1 Tax=Bacillaceae TaxID=186817 RepID=UPI001F4865C6|nr:MULTISPECIES: allantoinase [Bacillaceae]MCF2648432.1 allantoinase [Niallia circulans]CAI9392064.1 Allantoinase [Bacillus sp. T2.9-1]